MEEEFPTNNLVESIRRRFDRLGGVDLPEIVRGPMREPPSFEATITLRPTKLHWLEGSEDR